MTKIWARKDGNSGLPDPTKRHKGHFEKWLEIKEKLGCLSPNEIKEKIGKNFTELLPQLPHNSPLRGPLLQKLVQGLHINEITRTLNISKRTHFRLLPMKATCVWI